MASVGFVSSAFAGDLNTFLDNACAPGRLVLVNRHRSTALEIEQAAVRSPEHPKSVAVSKMVILSERLATKKTAGMCSSKENGCRKVLRQAKRRDPLTFRRAHHFTCSSDYLYSVDTTPNDPYYSLQYGFEQSSDADIDAGEAWEQSTGNDPDAKSEPVVGVVDTGIDYTHSDLKNNMWVNYGEIPGNGLDDDANGVIDDVYGYNGITGVKRSGDPKDDHYHGTHVAGTIGAEGNNGVGVAGVAWHTKLMALKFLSSSGSGSTSDAIKVLLYALAQKKRGVNIVALNNSWGGGGYSASLLQAIKDLGQAGIIFVVAAGNSATNNDKSPSYPANYVSDNIITVAAVDDKVALASFSNYGPSTVHIAAPGQNIVSTYPGDKYAYLSGTSMAAPHVTGAIALAAAFRSGVSRDALQSAVLGGAQTRDSLQGLVAGGRYLNVANILDLLAAPSSAGDSDSDVAAPDASPAPDSDAAVDPTPTPAPPEATATPVPPPTVTPKATATPKSTIKKKKKTPPKTKRRKVKKQPRKAHKKSSR